ncbi:DNA-processing protein DprA [Peribacillus butanolivorans]|uniref:DNA-processing protein DprA n=1 Tax=Peribacillus butanolivorans TaxID=421767 RepID=UPI002E22DA67|nr:DNA-processing protein DprA [Peribacillus butanolivorans]MED3690279.1 DNA-processing protein DprA [Peribacillus butanolivorans]
MRNNNTRSILLLLKQFGFSDKTLRTIYQNEESIIDIIFNTNHPFHNKYIDIYTSKEKVISQDYNALLDFSNEFSEKMKMYKNGGVKVYCSIMEDFPSHLFESNNAPLFLYCYGNLELMKQSNKKVAIVGTRNSTKRAGDKTKDYVKEYVNRGWITVSGLAKGIDTIVHKETIVHKGNTIAVLPTSFEKIYPAENEGLFKDIIENDGLAVTVTGPFENTYKSNFTDRNSIVAKMSDEIFVIEASIKSGTLNTVRKGNEYNKKIYFDSTLLTDEVIDYIGRFNAIDVKNKGG